tara:strand:+ start:394 stop:597 length:204 start_codon:yes stop_codon:yes gene_type:complete
MWFITETTWVVTQTFHADNTTAENACNNEYDENDAYDFFHSWMMIIIPTQFPTKSILFREIAIYSVK